MFELVKSIRSELSGTPLQPTPARISERFAAVQDVIARLYRSAIPQNQVNISVSANNCFHYADFSSCATELQISPLLLIDSEEIPERFRFANINDPRLNNAALLQDYSDWLHDTLEIPRSQYSADKDLLQSNLVFMQDREKAKEAIKFVLLHELGHIHHNDYNLDRILFALSGIMSISWPICVALALSWPLSISISFVLGAASLSFFVLGLIQSGPLARFYEYRADLFAAQHCSASIEGGIYFFRASIEDNKRMRQILLNAIERRNYLERTLKKCLIDIVYSPEGERLVRRHPSLFNRIAALEAFKQEMQLGQTLVLA